MKAKATCLTGLIILLTMVMFAVPVFAQESFTIGVPKQSEYKVSAGDEVSFSFEMNDPIATTEDTYTFSV